MATQAQLNTAAVHTINILRGINQYSSNKIAIIGGLAVWTQIPGGRMTRGVDFVIDLNYSDTLLVKPTLLALPNSPFSQPADIFYYEAPNGLMIQTQFFSNAIMVDFLPEDAQMLGNLPPAANLPYTSVLDLVALKMYSCSMRGELSKRNIDAIDADLLEMYLRTRLAPVGLTGEQRRVVEEGINHMVGYGDKNRAWWRARLGV